MDKTTQIRYQPVGLISEETLTNMWDLLIGKLKKSNWPVDNLHAPKMQAVLLDKDEFINVTNQVKSRKQTQDFSEMEWGEKLSAEDNDGFIIRPNVNAKDNVWTIFLLHDEGHPLNILFHEIAHIVEWNLKMKPGSIANKLKKNGMKIGRLPKYGGGV